MTDFLLELRSEEIPARMQAKARDDLAKLFTAELAKTGVTAAEIITYATPRRLALIARGLPMETGAIAEETKGPKVGAPPQAFEGFLRKVGLTQDQLVERDGVFYAITQKPGQRTADILAGAIPAIIRAFPWPKSQRWGADSISTESLRWVRPLSGIVALFGGELVVCNIGAIHSSAVTHGHRFHSSGEITITNAGDYAEKLYDAHVIVDHAQRQDIIRSGAAKAAADAGLTLIADEGLVTENAGLTEWPVPMLGRFDAAFLAVPPEVIQLTARVNQKYFVCETPLPLAGGAGGGHIASSELPTPNPSRKREGDLTNAFVCTANIAAHDGGAAIVAGNEKVLAARLSDAKFFWEQDLKILLKTQAEKLSSIVFHEKLGTVADKAGRVAKLARWLVEQGIVKSSSERRGGPAQLVEGQVEAGSFAKVQDNTPVPLHHPTDGPPPRAGEDLAAEAERAARLCKADLVTGMVGEFPELQGIMGGYYARAQGEDDAVADAIRDHYKPVGQGDDVPTAPVTVAVSLADKLDTLCQFFLIDEAPTGSKDPFALRRATLGIISLILGNGLRFRLQDVLLRVVEGDLEKFEVVWHGNLESKLAAFFADRLKVQQREAGVRHDLIDAVFALGGEDDLVRLLARVHALQAFVGTDEGANLLAGYKRAANILKSSPERGGGPAQLVEGQVPLSTDPQDNPPVPLHHPMDGSPPHAGEELDLLGALNTAEPAAAAAIATEDFAGAMTALASLRAPIDAFFDGVMVNDPDPDKRAFRIGLLTRFRYAVHTVADFSKIEG